MDKIKEVEEISTHIVEEYLELLKPFVQQIERLNTHIKELENRFEGSEKININRINEIIELKLYIGKLVEGIPMVKRPTGRTIPDLTKREHICEWQSAVSTLNKEGE